MRTLSLAILLVSLSLAAVAAEPVRSLAECEALAREQSPEVQIARRNLDQARAQVTVANAGRLPILRADGYIQRRERRLRTNGGANPDVRPEDYTLQASLAQNLYSSGAVRERIAIARLGEQVARENLRSAQDASALAVRLAFQQLLTAEQALAIRREAAGLLQQQVDDQEGRLKAGTVSSLNVTRARVTLANEQPAVAEAEREVVNARLQLAQVMGLSLAPGQLGPGFRIRGSLDSGAPPPPLGQALAQAKANRSELAARRFEVEAAERAPLVERAANRPQINGFANYQLFSESSRSSSRENFGGFLVGVSASWTLFDGFATPGRVRAAQARASAAREALRATELAVETELRSAYALLEQARATRRSQAQNADLAREGLRLAMDNFGAGLATQLDILQAQVDLTRARLNELGGRALQAAALARITRAIGSPAPAPAPRP